VCWGGGEFRLDGYLGVELGLQVEDGLRLGI
jgi:hypothetical protein